MNNITDNEFINNITNTSNESVNNFIDNVSNLFNTDFKLNNIKEEDITYYDYPILETKYKEYDNIFANNGYYTYTNNGGVDLVGKKKHITEQQQMQDKLCNFINDKTDDNIESFNNYNPDNTYGIIKKRLLNNLNIKNNNIDVLTVIFVLVFIYLVVLFILKNN